MKPSLIRPFATAVIATAFVAIASIAWLTSRVPDDTAPAGGHEPNAGRTRQANLQAIRELHATVRFDSEGNVVEVWFHDPVALSDMGHEPRDLTNSDLKLVAAFPELKYLSVSGCSQITDAGLAHIRQLTQLESLDASYTSITGDGLVHLARMDRLIRLRLLSIPIGNEGLAFLSRFAQLRHLSLSDARITDIGIRSLSHLDALEYLYLGDAQISDEGLKHLVNSSTLRILQLDNVPVTDGAVRSFKMLNQLRYLKLQGTSVSQDGALQVREALPDCKVNWRSGR